MDVFEFRDAVKNAKSIDDLAEYEPVKVPSLFTKNKNLIIGACREHTRKVVEFIEKGIKDIEILYNSEGTGFDIFVNLDGDEHKVISIDWNTYTTYSAPRKRKYFSINQVFYEKQEDIENTLFNLNYRSSYGIVGR